MGFFSSSSNTLFQPRRRHSRVSWPIGPPSHTLNIRKGSQPQVKTSPSALPQSPFEDYLNLLGVQRREPGIEALSEIVQAHLTRIPFENISKLYYKKQLGLRSLPSLELFLDGIERFHFGGTCYTNNYYFGQLLANLGYETKLCGADMSNPDVHLVNMVTVEKRQYLVDVGYAAPFLMPLGGTSPHSCLGHAIWRPTTSSSWVTIATCSSRRMRRAVRVWSCIELEL